MADRLVGVDPRMVAKAREIERLMAEAGHPVRCTSGLRTLEQQQELWKQGRGKPGRRVTDADGVRVRSNHQANPATGLGEAVDFCFQGQDPYAETHPWSLLGSTGEALGLSWGGRWGKPDRPHFELPKTA